MRAGVCVGSSVCANLGCSTLDVQLWLGVV
jgi:hypothetical protein